MILIQNNWEQVDTIEDIIRVIKYYYSNELGQALENVNSKMNTDVIDDLKNECDSLENENNDLQGYIDELENENEDLKQELKKLEDRISELESK